MIPSLALALLGILISSEHLQHWPLLTERVVVGRIVALVSILAVSTVALTGKTM